MTHDTAHPQDPSGPAAAAAALTPAADTDADAPGRERFGWRDLSFPLAVFAVHLVLAVLVSYVSLRVNPRTYLGEAIPEPHLFQGLFQFDSGWFERIARDGYVDRDATNFFPLFPLLGRGVHAVTRLPEWQSLLLVANAFGLLSLVVIYRIFRSMADDRAARWAVVLWAAYPFSFFHVTAYPETLMIASSAVGILLATRGRHAAAGVAVGLGMLARHLSALGWLSVFAAGVQQLGWRPRRLLTGGVALGFVLATLLVGSYFAYQWATFGDPLAWAKARSSWGESAWYNVLSPLYNPEARRKIYLLYIAMSVVPGVGAYLLLREPRWRVLAPFAIGLMLLIWSSGLAGLGRYSASCWPAFLPIGAMVLTRPALRWAVAIAFAAIQAVMLCLFCHALSIL